MHRGVITCWTDEPVVDVVRRLCEYNINAIFVLDESGRAVGVVSQTDLARAYVQDQWQDQTASTVMDPDVVTIPGDIPLNVAIELMLDRRMRRILIVQGGRRPNRPVGVLSLSDVMREMAGYKPPD
jgi:CBS domain-containing protein